MFLQFTKFLLKKNPAVITSHLNNLSIINILQVTTPSSITTPAQSHNTLLLASMREMSSLNLSTMETPSHLVVNISTTSLHC